MSHYLVGVIRDDGILTYIAEVGAYKAEGLFHASLLDFIDLFYGPLVEKVAAYPIHRIGRVDDYATVVQDFNGLSNKPHLGIFIVY